MKTLPHPADRDAWAQRMDEVFSLDRDSQWADLQRLLGGALFTDIARPVAIIHDNRDIEGSSVSVLYPMEDAP